MGTMIRMKPVLLIATGFLVMACLCNPISLLPSDEEPMTDTDTSPSPVSVIENDYFTVIRLLPAQGNLGTLLREHAQTASSQGRLPVVEFDAEW